MTSRLHINTGADLSGLGLTPRSLPFKTLGGSLYAAYVLGNSAAAFERTKKAPPFGVRYDWSGNGRHLTTEGTLSYDGWSMTTGIAVHPEMPFILDEVVAVNGSVTVVVFASSETDSKAVSLVRSGATKPYHQFALSPPALISNNYVEASSTTKAFSNGLSSTAVEGVTAYAAATNSVGRDVYAISPAGESYSATNSTAKTFTSAGAYYIGQEAGSGTANGSKIYGVAVYAGYLTASDLEEIQSGFRTWHLAVESGIAV